MFKDSGCDGSYGSQQVDKEYFLVLVSAPVFALQLQASGLSLSFCSPKGGRGQGRIELQG